MSPFANEFAHPSPITLDKDGYPIVDAYDTGTHYVCWCRYCQEWHSHGRGNGHRAADCVDAAFRRRRRLRTEPESPFRKTGYVVRCVGPVTPDVRQAIRRGAPFLVTIEGPSA